MRNNGVEKNPNSSRHQRTSDKNERHKRQWMNPDQSEQQRKQAKADQDCREP